MGRIEAKSGVYSYDGMLGTGRCTVRHGPRDVKNLGMLLGSMIVVDE